MAGHIKTRDAELTAEWLAAVAEGLRVVTKSRLDALLRWSTSEEQRCLAAWEAAGWLQPVPDARGVWAVGESCPGVPDSDTLDLEILLARAAPKTPAERLGFGYRTALMLHGLSQEFGDGVVFICTIGPERRVPERASTVPFQRSAAKPGDAVCEWKHLRGYVVRRDERAWDAGVWHRTAAGLRVTGPARTLVDCWLRPGYGVDDDRWMAAWQSYWEDARFGSRTQKGAALLAVHRVDQDARAGRAEAFARLIEPYDKATASAILGLAP